MYCENNKLLFLCCNFLLFTSHPFTLVNQSTNFDCGLQVTPADVEDCRETTTFALKRCTFGSWSKDVVDGYKQEIQFLNLLRRKPGIIQLIDSQIWEEPGIIYMVLEEGEIDLKDLLKRNRQIRQAMEYSSPDWCFIRCHWRAMLDVSMNQLLKQSLDIMFLQRGIILNVLEYYKHLCWFSLGW